MESNIRLTPVMGMDTETDATQLVTGGDAPAVFVRDAVNMDFNAQGKPALRRGLRMVSDARLLDLLHDGLHGDTFGRDAEHYLVRLNTIDGRTQRLHYAGDMPVSMWPQARRTLFATARGILEYDGRQTQVFTLPTPAAPILAAEGNGALDAGTYTVALAWLRGDTESACSEAASVQVRAGERVRVTLPLCLDGGAECVRVFVSEPDGGQLYAFGTFDIATTQVEIAAARHGMGAPRFRHMDAMPTGRYLCAWSGRLLTAQANLLRFSEPLAWHVHDARHGFIQMPQRITFLAPVDGGVFVGQADHVAFLTGSDIREVSVRRIACKRPVPDSAVLVGAPVAPREAGGRPVAVWLAENGHVVGMPDGSITEPRAGRLAGIAGARGCTVTLNSKLLTLTT